MRCVVRCSRSSSLIHCPSWCSDAHRKYALKETNFDYVETYKWYRGSTYTCQKTQVLRQYNICLDMVRILKILEAMQIFFTSTLKIQKYNNEHLEESEYPINSKQIQLGSIDSYTCRGKGICMSHKQPL